MTKWVITDRTWALATGDEESTRIYAELRENGDLYLSGADSGPSVESTYGDWDYEYWLTVKAADVPAAFAALLKHTFSSEKRLYWTELCQLMEGAGLKIEEGCWM